MHSLYYMNLIYPPQFLKKCTGINVIDRYTQGEIPYTNMRFEVFTRRSN